ncbi:MAG: hypothetical protein C4548_02670 [Desulfobacteraceae bacterium]|nr:MAG: hypothetical protein C4548_02670 [Desulfobacteraceae bacterium]
MPRFAGAAGGCTSYGNAKQITKSNLWNTYPDSSRKGGIVVLKSDRLNYVTYFAAPVYLLSREDYIFSFNEEEDLEIELLIFFETQ